MSYGNSKYIDAHPEHQITNKTKQGSCKTGEHKALGWSRQIHTKQNQQSQSWHLGESIESLRLVTRSGNITFLGYRASTHAEFFQSPQNRISSPKETLHKIHKDTLVYVSRVIVL